MTDFRHSYDATAEESLLDVRKRLPHPVVLPHQARDARRCYGALRCSGEVVRIVQCTDDGPGRCRGQFNVRIDVKPWEQHRLGVTDAKCVGFRRYRGLDDAHPRASPAGSVRGTVGTAVADHNDLKLTGVSICQEAGEQAADGVFLVVRRNDHARAPIWTLLAPNMHLDIFAAFSCSRMAFLNRVRTTRAPSNLGA